MRESKLVWSKPKRALTQAHTQHFPFFLLYVVCVYYWFLLSIPFYQIQNLFRSSEKCQDGLAAIAACRTESGKFPGHVWLSHKDMYCNTSTYMQMICKKCFEMWIQPRPKNHPKKGGRSHDKYLLSGELWQTAKRESSNPPLLALQ